MPIPVALAATTITTGIITDLAAQIVSSQLQRLENTTLGNILEQAGLIEKGTDDNLQDILEKSLRSLFDEHPEYQITGIINFFNDPDTGTLIRDWVINGQKLDESEIARLIDLHIGNEWVTRSLLEKRNIDPNQILPDFCACYLKELRQRLSTESIAIIQAVESSKSFTLTFLEEIKTLLERGRLDSPVSRIAADELKKLFLNASNELREYPQTIASSRISIDKDQEISKLLSWIKESSVESNLAFLIDKPGSGKTVVMSKLLNTLEDNDYVALGIKADSLLNVRTRSDLQEVLGLPDYLRFCVEKVAKDEMVIILIDQIDALSISLSQDYDTLDLIHKLTLEIKKIPNVKIIISSREFDINFDPKLSSLRHNQYNNFHVEPLSREQVEFTIRSLGDFDDLNLSDRMFSFLSLPLNLNFYAKLLLESEEGELQDEYFSLQQLYEQLWDHLIHAKGRRTSGLIDAINTLVTAMRDRRKLVAPISVLDDEEFRQAKDYLQSIDFIRKVKSGYVFSHQTLFDYCYVRNFLSRNVSISSEIINDSSQGLFERSQMLQVIIHLRSIDFSEYIRELEILLFSPDLRFHLRFLLIEWFAGLTRIDSDEKIICFRLLDDQRLFEKFLQAAAKYKNEQWFDVLGDDFFQNRFVDLSSSEAYVSKLYLTAIINRRTEEILSIIQSLRNKEGGKELHRDILLRLEDWRSKIAIDLLIELFDSSEDLLTPSYFIGSIFEHLAKSNPVGSCHVFRIYLEKIFALIHERQQKEMQAESENSETLEFASAFISRMQVRQPYRNILEDYHFQISLAKSAQNASDEFVKQLLPWFLNIARSFAYTTEREDHYISDAIFSYYIYTYHHPPQFPKEERETTFIKAMAMAVATIAKTNRDWFLEIASELASTNLESAHFILIHGFLADPRTYSDEIVNYLTDDIRRFDIGDRDYDSRILVRAAFKHGTQEQRERLENIILHMRPDWEIEGRYLGAAQKRFLSIIPEEQLSSEALKRLQELERNDRVSSIDVSPPVGVRMGAVVSPISNEQIKKISDKDLLKLMRKYDESTSWGMPREEFLRGGIVEFSREIAVEAKESPERFYEFARTHYDEEIAVEYIGSTLSGLADSDAKSEWVFELATLYAGRFVGFGRTGFCRSLQKRMDDGVPDQLLDTMSDWAINDPHPNAATEQQSSSADKHEWLTAGINSVRGVALESVCRCALKKEIPQPDRVFELLDIAVDDVSPAVGACVLHSAPMLLDFDRQRTLDLLSAQLENHQVLLNDPHSSRILSWLTFHYFDQFGHFLETMLDSELDYVRRQGSSMACAAALNNPNANTLCERAIVDSPDTKRGAANTYAKYIKNPNLRQRCLDNLHILLQEEDEEIHKEIAWAFNNLQPTDINSVRSFLYQFVNSKAFATESWQVIDYVREIALFEHQIALDVTESYIAMMNSLQSSRNWRDDDVVSLPLTVYNRSIVLDVKDRAISLFEKLLDRRIGGAYKALEQWDEHRDWKFVFNKHS